MYLFWIMFVYLLLCIIRVIKGPSIWDRILGFNLISTKIVLIIVLYASLYGTAYYLDFAIVYALLGFIGVIFIAQFIYNRRGK